MGKRKGKKTQQEDVKPKSAIVEFYKVLIKPIVVLYKVLEFVVVGLFKLLEAIFSASD